MHLRCPRCESECTVHAVGDSTRCSSCGLELIVGSTEQIAADSSWEPTAEMLGGAPTESLQGVPRSLGRYRVNQFLGGGGFASVYLAEDAELARQVAIKVPRADRFGSTQQVDAFLREARAVADLEHPGFVTVYDVGRDERGSCYIVMQYMPGGSLRQRMLAQPIAPADAAAIISTLAKSIDVAHKSGLYHRDLKPENILFDAHAEPRIADFGLAIYEHEQLQHAGEVAGTYPYMAPEQLIGDVHRLDGRADIWALGVMLYEMLAKRRPFQGQHQTLVDEVLNREPRPLRQIDETISRDLDRICLKCLAKPVEERYTTAADVVADFATCFRDGEALVAAKNGWSQLVRRRPAVVLAAGGLAACLATVLFASLAGSRNADSTGQVVTAENYDLDEVARLHVPVKLLDRSPRELLWLSRRPSTHWTYLAEQERVSMVNPMLGLLELADTQSEDFDLSVTIFKTELSGSSGLFWGYQDASNDGTSLAFHILWIEASRDGSKPAVSVRREFVEVEPVDGQALPRVNSEFVSVQTVSMQSFNEYTLLLRIRGGELTGVTWDGVDCPDIAATHGMSGNKPVHGRFGLINKEGTVVFSDVEFKLTNLRGEKSQ